MVLADVDDEAHEVARLLVEAERVHRPEAEGRVADPAEAVVPVAFPARRLRQRGGRGGDDRPGRRVGEALEDEGRALQVDPPGVVGELAVAQPVAPELFGRVEPLQRLGGAARAAEVARSPQVTRAEAALVLAQLQRAAHGPALDRQIHVAGQPQLGRRPRRGRRLRPARRRSRSRLRARSRSAAGTPSPSRPRRRCRSSSAAASGRTRVRCRGGCPCRRRSPTRRSSAGRGRRPSRCRSPRWSRSPACPARSGGRSGRRRPAASA